MPPSHYPDSLWAAYYKRYLFLNSPPAPFRGSSGVVGWESSDSWGGSQAVGSERCRSRAGAPSIRVGGLENRRGEATDGAQDKGGRADCHEAGEGVWSKVTFCTRNLVGHSACAPSGVFDEKHMHSSPWFIWLVTYSLPGKREFWLWSEVSTAVFWLCFMMVLLKTGN